MKSDSTGLASLHIPAVSDDTAVETLMSRVFKATGSEATCVESAVMVHATEADFKISPTATYNDICSEMHKTKKVMVASGYEILGNGKVKATDDPAYKPVSLLTLAESESDKFALVFSMSHSVGKFTYTIFYLQMFSNF